MIVRFVFWLVFLAVYCVALEDLEVSTDGIEFDNNTFVDNVAFQSDKCDDANPCQNGGTCLRNGCSCLNGTSGPLCEIIDDCRSRCGYANCFYNVTSRDIYCSCNSGYAFDDYSKICRACDCGSYGIGCSYVEGKKKCICLSDAYADKLGTCMFCYCRYARFYNGCEFDDYGRKKCNCLKGFAQRDENCETCNCGDHGNCTLYGWSKTCRCEKGYAEKYGTCEECDCGENGTCSFYNGFKRCYCDHGFSENNQGKCQECDCKEFSRCGFDIYGRKECSCIDEYALKSEVCTPCNCDPGTSCIFKNDFEKECICPDGYANFIGRCEKCDCEMAGSNCTMDGGLKQCHCPKGFEPWKVLTNPVCTDKNECLRPQDNDCPPLSTKCVNKWGSYDCECKDGFEVIKKYGDNDIKKDGCKDIDECLDSSACIYPNTLCVNAPGSYRCECKAGYSVEKSFKEKYNNCDEDSRPWKTASIVAGCLFGFVSFGLLITICTKHVP